MKLFHDIQNLNWEYYARQYDVMKYGRDFDKIGIFSILFNKMDIDKMLIQKNKELVLKLFDTQERVYLSDITRKLELDGRIANAILNKLKIEGKIKTC